MNKMNKILAILLALTMMMTLAACNSGNSGNSGDGTSKTTAASGDMVTAELPSGWSLVTGTDMNGDDMADFICHAEEFEYGDPYLQVEEYPRDPDSAKTVPESGDPYETYDWEKELTNST